MAWRALEDRVDFFGGHASGINNAVGDLDSWHEQSRNQEYASRWKQQPSLERPFLVVLRAVSQQPFGRLLRRLSGSHRGESFLSRSRRAMGDRSVDPFPLRWWENTSEIAFGKFSEKP